MMLTGWGGDGGVCVCVREWVWGFNIVHCISAEGKRSPALVLLGGLDSSRISYISSPLNTKET